MRSLARERSSSRRAPPNAASKRALGQRVEQRHGLQPVARRPVLERPAGVDRVLHARHDQLLAQLGDAAVAELEHLGEVVAGVDVQDRAGELRRPEGLLGQAQQHDRVLAAAEQQHRPLELRRDLAHDEDRLILERVHAASLTKRSRPLVRQRARLPAQRRGRRRDAGERGDQSAPGRARSPRRRRRPGRALQPLRPAALARRQPADEVADRGERVDGLAQRHVVGAPGLGLDRRPQRDGLRDLVAAHDLHVAQRAEDVLERAPVEPPPQVGHMTPHDLGREDAVGRRARRGARPRSRTTSPARPGRARAAARARTRRRARRGTGAAGRPSPVSLKRWKYSLGMPATPVAFNSSHSSVLPLRCVAHTIKPDILDRIT